VREILPEEWERILGIIGKDELKLKSGQLPDLKSFSRAKELLEESLKAALPQGRSALLFSGGVDSALLARLMEGREFTAYCVGFKGETTKYPEDLEFADRIAQSLGIRLKTRLLNLPQAEKAFRKAVQLVGQDVVKASVAAVEIAAISEAKKDGFDTIVGGLGAEETFAGYQRHRLAEDVTAECIRGLRKCWDQDIVRENAIADAYSVRGVFPFLHPSVVHLSFRMPDKWKCSGGRDKIVLRELASDLDIPFYDRKKRAAQYGSRFHVALAHLSRKHISKKDYLHSVDLNISSGE